VQIDQAAIDKRHPADTSRLVLGQKMPATPIWDQPWAGDADADAQDGRYMLPDQGYRLAWIFPRDDEPVDEQTRQRLAAARGTVFALRQLRDAEQGIVDLQALPGSWSPRTVYGRDGTERRDWKRSRHEQTAAWNDIPGDVPMPVLVDMWDTNPTARQRYEELSEQRREACRALDAAMRLLKNLPIE
jgi:hypothetical protein